VRYWRRRAEAATIQAERYRLDCQRLMARLEALQERCK